MADITYRPQFPGDSPDVQAIDWTGLVDVLLALLLIFILLVASFIMSNYRILGPDRPIVAAILAREEAIRQRQAELTLDIEGIPILRDRVEITESDAVQSVRFPGIFHFDSGSARLNVEATRIITELGKELSKIQDELEVIEIVGHADPRLPQEGARFRDNLDLSCLRAASALRILADQALLDRSKLSAVCKSSFDSTGPPPNDVDLEEFMARSRRIDIRLRYSRR